nr:CDP-alcohol phosphatidyltransferase family protein [Paenibacillus faecalis]
MKKIQPIMNLGKLLDPLADKLLISVALIIFKARILMEILIIILVIGLFGIISNQFSGLRRIEKLEKTLDEINESMKTMNDRRNRP